ncbi:rod shape-determining protein RodA [Sporosarcina sp. ANT_H38]|uniref:FtsW/RodA/SpoVE family cell cycle protein n=1 Tax=Sporosarcina sp. ANT_H38 TaxID=2597358 RepID=UPI0011F3CE6D|nr:FtsW/RodA/SpoVE family cell cycle protein [Sporosarcina sp. ANT_H38]KAA0955447.1 rod shape-determining protein RodA [Sporosarcina sp. ANT_H38]
MNDKPADRFDWTLAFLLLLFCFISLFAIASAQTTGQYTVNYVLEQLKWYVVGIIIIALTMYLEPEQYKKIAWFIYGGGVFLLALLIILPDHMELVEKRNGAKSWFHLPKVGSIQPAEFMKTFFIISMARLITKHHEKFSMKTLKTDFYLLAKIIVVLFVPLLFIMLQTDLGTSLVFIAITVALIIVSGISWRIILPLFTGISAFGATVLWAVLYQQDFLQTKLGFKLHYFERIYSWIDPYSYSSNEGMHLITSLNAIGSGELFGKGYKGREVYVPESHTDFIFTTIAEEWGFIGSTFVICLYFFLIYYLTIITLELKDPFSTYICAGIIAMITFHVFENIGMTIQLLPITGIPLPFISYGGSSLMGNMLAIGLVFSLKFHHRSYMFSSDEE